MRCEVRNVFLVFFFSLLNNSFFDCEIIHTLFVCSISITLIYPHVIDKYENYIHTILSLQFFIYIFIRMITLHYWGPVTDGEVHGMAMWRCELINTVTIWQYLLVTWLNLPMCSAFEMFMVSFPLILVNFSSHRSFLHTSHLLISS